MSNQHLEIVPSNITSTGKLSYKNGQPTIQLLIGAQERSIVPGSIRLCGEFTVMLNNTIIPLESDKVRMNERLGVHSVIDTLSVFSQQSGQTIETINHHNRREQMLRVETRPTLSVFHLFVVYSLVKNQSRSPMIGESVVYW